MYIVSVKSEERKEWLYLTAMPISNGPSIKRVISLSNKTDHLMIFKTIEEAKDYCYSIHSSLKDWIKRAYADEKTLSIRKLVVRHEEHLKL